MDTHTKTSEKDVKGFYLIADVRDRIAVVGGIDGAGEAVSRAIRTTSATMMSSIGGRPGRFG